MILRDRAAMGASAQSVRAEMMRRILAAAAAGLCVIWSIGMTVSYFRNRALESRVEEAARGIGQSSGGPAGLEWSLVRAVYSGHLEGSWASAYVHGIRSRAIRKRR